MVWTEDNLSHDSWQCVHLASHPDTTYVPKDTILDISPITVPTQAQSPILSHQYLNFFCVQLILLPVLLTCTNQNNLSVMRI